METKEIKINVPEGYEIDKKNSTFEKIVFKKKEEESWRERESADSTEPLSGYYIDMCSGIYSDNHYHTSYNRNVFATEKQAKSALAMAQISQIMANDERFGGPVTDEEWKDLDIKKWVIRRRNNDVFVDWTSYWCFFLAFHTEEQRDLFLEENDDLVRDYLMID